MKANYRMLVLTLFVIVLAVFNLLVFLLPFTRTVGFWVSYFFSVIAFFSSATVIIITLNRLRTLPNIHGLSIYLISSIYLVLQLLLCFILMTFESITHQAAMISNVSLLGIFLIMVVFLLFTMDLNVVDEKRVKQKMDFLKTIEFEIVSLTNRTDDEQVKSVLEKLIEEVKFSDPISNVQCAPLEDLLLEKVVMLGVSLNEGDDFLFRKNCREFQTTLLERNIICKRDK